MQKKKIQNKIMQIRDNLIAKIVLNVNVNIRKIKNTALFKIIFASSVLSENGIIFA